VRIDKFVKRHTRIILGFIVVLMALPLVVTFGPWSPGGGVEDSVKGTLPTGEKILTSEWMQARTWAWAFHRLSVAHYIEDEIVFLRRSGGMSRRDVASVLNVLRNASGNPAMIQMAIQSLAETGKSVDELSKLLEAAERPPEEHFADLAWHLAAVGRKAAALGIAAGDEEVDRWIQDPQRPWFLPVSRERFAEQAFNAEAYARTLQELQMTEDQFRHFVAALLRHERYLSLMTDHAGPEEGDLKPAAGPRSSRLLYAIFDPEELSERIVATPGDIQKYYDSNRQRFTAQRRIVLDYVIAEYEDFASKVPAPTEEELKGYYDGHPGEFTAPAAAPAPGQEAPQAKPKPFEEVREQIRKTLVRQRTRPLVQAAFSKFLTRVLNELGNERDPVKRAARGKEVNLVAIAAEFRAAGDPLTWGTTPHLTRGPEDAKLVEEKIGAGLSPRHGWRGFVFGQKEPPVGTINEVPEETDRGLVLHRLLGVAEAGPLPLDDAVERKVRRIVEGRERNDRTRTHAGEFARILKARGLAAALEAARGHGFRADVGQTDYSEGGASPTVPGVFDRTLTQAIQELSAAGAEAEPWKVVPLEIERTPRVLCVYLDDTVALPSGDFMTELRERRDALRWRTRAEARLRLQDEIRKSLVLTAAGS
jgi:hypothetical protein